MARSPVVRRRCPLSRSRPRLVVRGLERSLIVLFRLSQMLEYLLFRVVQRLLDFAQDIPDILLDRDGEVGLQQPGSLLQRLGVAACRVLGQAGDVRSLTLWSMVRLTPRFRCYSSFQLTLLSRGCLIREQRASLRPRPNGVDCLVAG